MKFWLRLARRLARPFFAVLPKRCRFAAALRMARFTAPIGTRICDPRVRALNDGTAIALWGICHVMNRHGIEFDVRVHVQGAAVVDQAQQRGRGLLLVSAHFLLNGLIVPWLRDRGWQVHAVRGAPDTTVVPGRREQLPWFAPSPQLLVKIRQAVRNGEVVMIDVDTPEPVSSGFALETSLATFNVSDVAPRMAERWGASVAFLETRATSAGVVATITPGDAGLRKTFEGWLGLSPDPAALCKTTRP